MAGKKQILTHVFEDVAYTLIGVHCNIEDYRLAYLINKTLGTTLARSSEDLCCCVTQSRFPIFEWEDPKYLNPWYLFSNQCKQKKLLEGSRNTLFFSDMSSVKTFYLIPEYKQVDYFLKIEDDYNVVEDKYILNCILKIPQIVTAYKINTDTLKSKDHLIFN